MDRVHATMLMAQINPQAIVCPSDPKDLQQYILKQELLGFNDETVSFQGIPVSEEILKLGGFDIFKEILDSVEEIKKKEMPLMAEAPKEIN